MHTSSKKAKITISYQLTWMLRNLRAAAPPQCSQPFLPTVLQAIIALVAAAVSDVGVVEVEEDTVVVADDGIEEEDQIHPQSLGRRNLSAKLQK